MVSLYSQSMVLLVTVVVVSVCCCCPCCFMNLQWLLANHCSIAVVAVSLNIAVNFVPKKFEINL